MMRTVEDVIGFPWFFITDPCFLGFYGCLVKKCFLMVHQQKVCALYSYYIIPALNT